MTRKLANTYMRHTEHWTAVSILLGLISCAYRDLLTKEDEQKPKILKSPKTI